jgi:ABC-type multidrug transport system fused ATPase/permease subunit
MQSDIHSERVNSESTVSPAVSQVVQADTRGAGRLIGSFFVRYLRAMDGFAFWIPLILLLTVVETGLSLLFRYVLSLWSAGELVPASPAAGLTAVLGVVVLGIIGRVLSWSTALIFLSRGALLLHDRAVVALGNTHVTYFDSQPSGRLLARLSDDYEKVSREIPNYVVDILSGTTELLWAVVLVLVGAPALLPVALPCAWAYYRHQRLFVNASRELQRLNKVLEAPSWSLFTESLSLAASQTIRVHGKELEFSKLLHERQKLFGRATLASSRLTRWLNVRLKIISEVFALAVVFVAIAALATGYMPLAACAFLMSLSIGLDNVMQWVTRAVSLLEPAGVSIERVVQLQQLPSEHANPSAPAIHDIAHNVSHDLSHDLSHDDAATLRTSKWRLQVSDLVAAYRPDLPTVLRGVSFVVEPGSRVGIIGRTGAGKTTIFQALYRMVHQVSGSMVLQADLGARLDVQGAFVSESRELDLCQIPLEEARSFFTIVPQDPVLFSGSIRYNLDRLGAYDDEYIWSVLGLVHLTEFVAGLPGALSYQLQEGGNNLSAGERQLLCIARAALNPVRWANARASGSAQGNAPRGRSAPAPAPAPAFVLLDEATANVDHRTDARIGAALDGVFRGSAVLIIAHRLETVRNCDKLIALSGGRIVAEGSPDEVLARIRFEARNLDDSGKSADDFSDWL